MLDILKQTDEFLYKSNTVAIARVMRTWRSSLRPVGSSLVVNEESEMIGSVSGGCVEKAVVAKSLKVMDSGKAELAKFGVADEDAWEVGLSCGGALTVLVQPFFSNDEWNEIQSLQNQNVGFAVITSISEHAENVIIQEEELQNSYPKAFELYMNRSNGVVDEEGQSYFVHSFPPKLTMLLIGSAHITSELIKLADSFGFDTVVVDPRDTFAKKTTYAVEPKALHVNWPQEILPDLTLDKNTFAVILSHDPKIDDEALKILIDKEVSYIGALGSKKTHAKRVARLEGYGFTEEQIARIHAPIGLPINALLPKEIALSVMAEIIKVKNEK